MHPPRVMKRALGRMQPLQIGGRGCMPPWHSLMLPPGAAWSASAARITPAMATGGGIASASIVDDRATAHWLHVRILARHTRGGHGVPTFADPGVPRRIDHLGA